MAALLETVHQLAEPAAQDPSGTGAPKTAAQLAEQTAQAALSSSAALPGGPWRAAGQSAEHFGDLVSVLVAGDREQSQQGSHRGESAAHDVAPYADESNQGGGYSFRCGCEFARLGAAI